MTMEDKVTATFEELAMFLNAGNEYIKEYKDEKTRLTYALHKQITRYAKKLQEQQAELNLECNSIRAKNAAIDDKGNLIENKFDVKQGKGEDNSILRFTYKPEQKIKCDKEIDALVKEFNKKIIEINPPYANAPFYVDVPEGFDFKYFDMFKKFIFDPAISEEEEEKLFLAKKPIEKRPTVQSVLN